MERNTKVAKWFAQAQEIERLRRENARLLDLLVTLKSQVGDADVDVYGVTEQERNLAANGQQVEAIKRYRERTGADLLTAKRAIDSVQ